jgi:hypothetical protein
MPGRSTARFLSHASSTGFFPSEASFECLKRPTEARFDILLANASGNRKTRSRWEKVPPAVGVIGGHRGMHVELPRLSSSCIGRSPDVSIYVVLCAVIREARSRADLARRYQRPETDFAGVAVRCQSTNDRNPCPPGRVVKE